MKTLCLLVLSAVLAANPGDFSASLVRLLGLESVESLSETLVEHYEQMSSHPLDINTSSRAELLSTGFFTPFQVASILDYISDNGPILSFFELSGIIGIGEQMADDLRWFFRCDPPRRQSLKSNRAYRSEVKFTGSIRESVRPSGEGTLAKYELAYGERVTALMAIRDDRPVFSVSLSGRRHLERLVVGGFNARFAQGLLLWNGFSMSGLYDLAGFSRNPTGLSSSVSSASLVGVASTWSWKRCALGIGLTEKGLAIMNYGFYTARGSYSLTALYENGACGASVDMKATLGLFTLWSEGALYYKDGVLGSAAVGGLYCNIAYGKRVGAFVKARSESFSVQNSNVTGLKPGQRAVGLGADWQAFSAVGEVLFRGQELSARGLEKWNWTAMWGEFQIEGELRHSWKYASGMKNELRASVSASGSPFYYGGRVQVQKGKDWSGLCYLEVGLRQALCKVLYFDARKWDDRLYAYARDVPGSFSVPAYYGKGLECSFSARDSKRWAIKAGYTFYFSDKADKWEVKAYVRF